MDLEPLNPSVALADEPAAPPPRRNAGLGGLLGAYLPMLLMVLLALGTWWLAKNSPVSGDGATEKQARHEPDYEMRTFAVQRFGVKGALKAQIEGDALRHYPDTDTIEIDNVRLRAVGADGGVTRAVARRAISNGDGSEVQLLGNAEVTREATAVQPAVKFSGEFLHAFLDTERIRSHLPVTVVRGETEVRAGSMDYSHLSGVLNFGGRMQTVFRPRPVP